MPRLIRPVLGLLGIWLVGCELAGLGVHGLPVGPEKWLHLVMMGTGAGLCLLRGVTRRDERAAWLLIGLGVLAWTVGELYFTAVLWNDASPPVPSPADAGYLLLPPLVFVGIGLLARGQIRGLPRSVWVDGITAGLAVGAASAAIVLRVVLPTVSGSAPEIITNLAYPVMDLMLLGLMFGLLAIGGRRPSLRFIVLSAGVLCFWGADSVYLVKSANGTWMSGGPYDPGWWAIALAAPTAAWMRPPRLSSWEGFQPSIRVPVGFSLIALAVLVTGSFVSVSVPAVVLASAAMVSVVLRLILTFRAHAQTLAGSRSEAQTDPLTGLGNRRAFTLALSHHLETATGGGILAMFDLDGFKAYNDSFGHGAGDALLQRLAERLDVLLGHDNVFRIGGDEFCALLPTGAAGETLLTAAAAALGEHGDGFAITASFGSVRLAEETRDVSEALRLADGRMYAMKNSGRRSGTAREVKRALLSAITQRDPDLGDHLDEVGSLAVACARELGCRSDAAESIGMAAELHDVGKVAVPEAILNKAGPLDEAEWALVREHPAAGERILSASPALADIAPLVRSSHERWDGTGYPDGLREAEIPLGARIVAVCDSFHAMTSDRPYRRAMSEEVALAELEACAGQQFDPRVTEAFVRGRRALRDGLAATRVRSG